MNKFIACLAVHNGKRELHIYTSATGLNILGSRHEKGENGEYMPDIVREFHLPENADNMEIAVKALEACQGFLDRNQNRPVKKVKKK